MNWAMPIGRDDFKELRQGGYYFVDKSEVIRKLIDHPAAVTLFTRPRRFGKTLLLSMLRYFLDIEGAEEHRKLFEGLAVSHDAEVMAQQGSRPVLFLTLKEWKTNTWDKMQQVILDALGQVFDEHEFLLQAETVTRRERMIFEKIQFGEANLVTCRTAMAFLLRLLEKYYGKKPVLLLDEYDVPIQMAWEHGYYDDAIDFFREFLSSALKTNTSLDFAILTGVLRISKESIFSDLNNLFTDSLLSPELPTAVGFTSEEVERMAIDIGHLDKMPEIRAWYDGYRIGGQEIYNPWSVLWYFKKGCAPATYWVNTSGNMILGELMEHANQERFMALEGLLQGGVVQEYLREGIIYSEIHEEETALYAMLLTTGYLTIAEAHWDGMRWKYDLRLPNREMLVLFTTEILKRFPRTFGASHLETLMRAFLHGDVAAVQRGLSDYLEILASTFDTGKEKESFYHGFVLGMTALLVPEYEVRSNRESGYGRYDVAVFPKDAKESGMVLEFKTAETEDALEKKADEALTQIKERDYDAEFRARGIAMVRHYGIAFCGKQVKVAADD